MLDYTSIKQLAKEIGRSVEDLLAQSSVTDPFYAGVKYRNREAEWFAEIWHRLGSPDGLHARRIHYLILTPDGEPFLNLQGEPYQNTDNDWKQLVRASLSARYLDLIPLDALVDRRNDEPMIFAPATDAERISVFVRDYEADVTYLVSEAEKAQLETEMADTKGHQRDGYWNSERKQARYREILNIEERAKTGSAPVPAEPVQMGEGDVSGALENLSAMGEVGAQFANEIRDTTARVTLETIEDTRVGILAELGASANEVASAFDGLGGNVQAAVFAEFGNPYVPRLPQADAADVAQFTEQASAGKILAAEWGSETPRKLAGVLYRWDRLTERLSDDEMVELDDFWRNRLRAGERAAVLRRLAT